jgi:hypothetical protein
VALIVSVCLARNTSRSFTCTEVLDFTLFWAVVHWTLVQCTLESGLS